MIEKTKEEIKYNNINYYWCNQCKIYERIEDERKDLYNDLDNLNDKVEILEEEKKIPEKLLGEPRHIYNENELYIVGKVNEILDYLESKEKGE